MLSEEEYKVIDEVVTSVEIIVGELEPDKSLTVYVDGFLRARDRLQKLLDIYDEQGRVQVNAKR